MPLVNSRLIADNFAKAGFATFIPDYLNGKLTFKYRFSADVDPMTNR